MQKPSASPPAARGWWWCYTPERKWEIVYVFEINGAHYGRDLTGTYAISEWESGTLWVGPLAAPDPPES